MSSVLVRLILFNILWIVTATLAKTEYVNLLLVGFSVLLLWDLKSARKSLIYMAAAIFVVGAGFDFLCAQFGVIVFYNSDGYFLPRWLLALWILFAWVARYLIFQFKDRRILISVLSGVFGPLSYYSGGSFGIVQITDIWFYPVYGAFWCLFIYLVHRFGIPNGREANGY